MLRVLALKVGLGVGSGDGDVEWDGGTDRKIVVHSLNVNGRDGSPLHLACRVGTLEMVELLVAHGADVNLVCPGMVGAPVMVACTRTRTVGQVATHAVPPDLHVPPKPPWKQASPA